jgi:Uri superfamily endonuclease
VTKGAHRTAAQTSYQLVIDVSAAVRITVGRLGSFEFPAGRYIYTGSARGGVEARVRRHLRRDKRLHWHVDFLLAAPGVRVVDTRRSTAAECILNQRTAGCIVAPGFGASDCRAGCGSHLKWLAGR